jgi:hypothetical protein
VNRIGIVNSGVAAYPDMTCPSGRTTYYYQLRHLKSLQYSYASNEANAKTFLKRPTMTSVVTIPGGCRISFTNNENATDQMIERSAAGGAFTALHTMTSQASGALTWDDTTGTAGVIYTYRVKSHVTGQTDSPYSTTAFAAGGWPIVSFVSASHSVDLQNSCPSSPNVTLTWATTGGSALDTVEVWRVPGYSGAHLLVARYWRTANGGVDWCRHTYDPNGMSSSWHYEFHLIDGGGTMQDNISTTPSNHMFAVTPCPGCEQGG